MNKEWTESQNQCGSSELYKHFWHWYLLFFFQVSGEEQFFEHLLWVKCKENSGGGGQSRCSPSLEICTNMGQPWGTSLFYDPFLILIVHNSPWNTGRSFHFCCSFSSFSSTWDAGGSAHLGVDLQCSTSPACFALTSWKNHLPSHSAELNWMVWGNLNISAFLFIYIWHFRLWKK